MFGFGKAALVTLITASINPKKVFPTLMTLGLIENELEEREERNREQQMLDELRRPLTPTREPDPYLMDIATVHAVEKLKAQGVEIPPVMQKNYERIKREWEGK